MMDLRRKLGTATDLAWPVDERQRRKGSVIVGHLTVARQSVTSQKSTFFRGEVEDCAFFERQTTGSLAGVPLGLYELLIGFQD
jgi:hypothetical protein